MFLRRYSAKVYISKNWGTNNLGSRAMLSSWQGSWPNRNNLLLWKLGSWRHFNLQGHSLCELFCFCFRPSSERGRESMGLKANNEWSSFCKNPDFQSFLMCKRTQHLLFWGIYIESPHRSMSGQVDCQKPTESREDRVFILNGDSVKRD